MKVFIAILIISIFSIVIYTKESKTLTFSASGNVNPQIKKLLTTSYKKIDIDIEFTVLPPKRALELSNKGHVDGELLRVPVIEKFYKNLVRVPVELKQNNVYFITKNPKLKDFSKESIKNYKIGIRGGHKYAEVFTQGFTNVIAARNSEQLIRLLNKNRVDIIIDMISEHSIQINKLKLDAKDYHKKHFMTINNFHYLHKKHIDLLPKITKILKDMKNNGEIPNILKSDINKKDK